MSQRIRVIALVDMDCFYCQVEEKLNPSLRGKPVAVVQYNLWRDGGIIAANYRAKEKGVTKGMWMHEAKNLCPEIEFARVAELRGRADLTKYREAGNQVAGVLSSFVDILERASVDEAYLDLTESVKIELSKGISNIPMDNLKTTHVVGCTTSDFISNITTNQDTDGFCEDDLKLAIGGIIVERMRAKVLEKTGYECSAGIAHNKILAKLVCGLNKPNKQTIIPQNAIFQYFAELQLKKIKRLGGKFGQKVAKDLKIQYVGELLNYSEKELANKFDAKTGHWLYNIARGIDYEPVSPKLICKSINCCKRFPGKYALFKYKDIEHWMNELCLEISERLQKDQTENSRRAKMITISYVQEINKNDASSSKTIPLKTYDAKKIAPGALEIIKNSCMKPNNSYHVKYLGLSAGNFEIMKKTKNIEYYLGKLNKTSSRKKLISENTSTEIDEEDKKNDKILLKQDLCSQFKAHDTDKTEFSEIEKPHHSEKSQQNSFSPDIKSFLPSPHRTELHNYTSGTHISSVSSKHNMEKFSYLPQVHGDNSVAEMKEIGESNTASIPEMSLGTVIDEDGVIDNSFFTRYFDNFDANTSNTTNKNEMELSVSTPNEGDTYIDVAELQYEHISPNDEQHAKCEECSQNILITEMISHRDYHYALNLHKEEMITNEQLLSSNNISDNEADDKLTKKRKTIGPSSALDSFLIKPELDSTEFTEICVQCNKKIKLTEWECHSDYHAAKELYRELNSKNNSLNTNKNKNIKSLGYDISRYVKRKSS